MLRFYAEKYIKLMRILGDFSRLPTRDSLELDAGAQDFLCAQFSQVEEKCLEIALTISAKHAENIKTYISRQGSTWGTVKSQSAELCRNIEREMSGKLFLYMPPKKANYYEMKIAFGEDLDYTFRSAIHDIEEAAKCLALGRNTACVFHLMRVMEVGLQALGQKLGVPKTKDRNWQSILNDINAVVKNLPDKNPKEKKCKEFYAGVAAHLSNVKVAWRNPVMHVRGVYSEEEARNVFSHVRAFMQQLARGL